jgi:hypothetical protein
MLKAAVDFDPNMPIGARSYVEDLLNGQPMEEVASEVVDEAFDSSFALQIGYWVDCTRIEEIENGSVEALEYEWKDVIRPLIEEKELKLHKDFQDEQESYKWVRR